MRRVFLIGFVMLYATMEAEGGTTVKGKKIAHQGVKLHESERFVVDLTTNFSADYFQKITDNPLNPRINSPLSTFILESLLSYGAGGASVKKYQEAIGLAEEAAQVAKHGYRSMLEKLSKYDVNIKTKLFVREGVELNANFANLSTAVFRAEIEPVEMSDGFIDTEKISEFIEGQTNKKIQRRFWPQELGCDTSIVLVNTANFEGTWKIGFDRSHTSSQPVSPLGSRTRQIPTMRTTGRFRHGSIDFDGVKAQFIEIPHESTSKDDKISLFIIMTEVADSDKWQEMIPKLRTMDQKKLLNSTEEELELWLPKFRFVNTARLDGPFRSEDDPEAPYDKNNISAIFASPESTILSDSFTKSMIEIDETSLRIAQSSLISYSPRPCNICDTYNQRLNNCRLIAEAKKKQCDSKKVSSSDRQTRSAVRQFRVDRPFVGLLMTTGHIFMDIFSISSSGAQFDYGDVETW